MATAWCLRTGQAKSEARGRGSRLAAASTARRRQTWKLSPQPQRPFSFGLVKVKLADMALTS